MIATRGLRRAGGSHWPGRVTAIVATLGALSPGEASAHAFGQRYDLPVPLWLFLLGAGAAVALSFVTIALIPKTAPARLSRAQLGLEAALAFAPIRGIRAVARILSVLLFVFLCLAGYFGVQDPLHNIVPTFLWVGLWVGMAYFAALVGNPWPAVNPYGVLFDWAERALRAVTRMKRLSLDRAYPAWLGAWPAAVGLLSIAWLELVPEGAERPAGLATGLLAYGAYCWAGMVIFGRNVFLERADVLTVAFGVLGRFAPLGRRGGDPSGPWMLRWPGTALMLVRPLPFSMMVFVLVMLSNVTFDGFIETPIWRGILDAIATSTTLRPLLIDLQSSGVNLLGAIKTAGLLLFPLLFVASYLVFCFLMSIACGRRVGTLAFARWFVLTLVPISIAYHLAHYASFFALAGQLLIPLASDPLGLGWDLFGTAHVHVDVSVISARFVWYTSVTTIVAGHVIAVMLAHLQAHSLLEDPKAALYSQIPMLVLMVGYTMTSLWILSQPVVKSSGFG